MSIQIEPYKLVHAICVVSFNMDHDLRYKIREIEQSFVSVFSAQVQAIGTNVPDIAPPAIPRFMLQSGPKQIAVSQMTVQIELNFNDQDKKFDETLEIIQKNFKKFWSGVIKFKTINEVKDIGMVLTLNKPLKTSQAEISQRLFDRFFKITPLGNVASAGFQVGFLDNSDHIFYNISANHYEMRELMVNGDKPSDPTIFINDVGNWPIKELGIELKLDVNSKPMLEAAIAITENIGDMLFDRLKELAKIYSQKLIDW